MRLDRYWVWIVLSIIVVMGPTGLAALAAEGEEPEQACHVTAMVVDPDPQGLNIRKGPGSGFEAILKIPTRRPVSVNVIGAIGKWLRIDGFYEHDQQKATLVDGWVFGPMLAVAARLEDGPAGGAVSILDTPELPKFKTIAQAPEGTRMPLCGCMGLYAKVTYKQWSGWLRPEEYDGIPAH